MAISDTISSIEANLQADYEGLENIGADLTGINKNIYNIRTILDTIYNDLPKVTGEGTEVTLSPTRKGRLALVPKGNSSQESTTGKQLALLDQSINNRHDDITYTENVANSVVGSKTSNNGQFLATFVAQVVSGQSYIISGTASNCGLYGYKETLGGESYMNISNSNLPLTITSNYTGTIILGMYISSVFSGTASIKNFQLEKGSTAHEWEKYTGRNTCTKPKLSFFY